MTIALCIRGGARGEHRHGENLALRCVYARCPLQIMVTISATPTISIRVSVQGMAAILCTGPTL